MSLRLCLKKVEISWSTIDGNILWSKKAWYSPFGSWRNRYRIERSDRLVCKTRSRTVLSDRASANRFIMIRILMSLSHSSSASTTIIYSIGQPSSFDSGRRTSWYHWSRRDWLVMSRRSVKASYMCWSREGILFHSCNAILVTNLPAWATSLPPREKKKLAPRCFRS
jgi:hypothetical protein